MGEELLEILEREAQAFDRAADQGEGGAGRDQPGQDVQEVIADVAAVDVAGTPREGEALRADPRVDDTRARKIHRHDRREQIGRRSVGEMKERRDGAVAPGRARHAAADPAPARARELVAQAGIVPDIGQRKADQEHRQREDVEHAETGERFLVEDVYPDHVHQPGPRRDQQERQQEADHQLPPAAAIFEAIAQHRHMVPDIAPDPRSAPEARPTQRHEHQREMAQVDGIELAQPSVIDRPARRQVGLPGRAGRGCRARRAGRFGARPVCRLTRRLLPGRRRFTQLPDTPPQCKIFDAAMQHDLV